MKLIAALYQPDNRFQNANVLAGHFGCSQLIIFINDPVINARLPAPGFPQTLPGGKAWPVFLAQSAAHTFYTGELPYPDHNQVLNATAIVCSNGSVAVLLGGAPTEVQLKPLTEIMPLLVALFEQELATVTAQTTSLIAEKAVNRAEKLTKTVDLMRMQLKDALVKQEKDKNAIENLLEKKDEFMNIASHELKTPIASMKAYLQVLAKQFPPGLNGAGTFIEKANRQADKLSNLVSDLLDVNKIQAGQMEFHFSEFDLMEIIHDAIAQFETINNTHNFIIKNEQPFIIKADKNRLEQVVSNLLGNAAKYSPGGQQVVIDITKTGTGIKVEVKDFGIGIPKEDHPYIFDRFFRAKDVVTRFAGLGLGLYISSEIIKRHCGEMGVCSTRCRVQRFGLRYLRFEESRTERRNSIIGDLGSSVTLLVYVLASLI